MARRRCVAVDTQVCEAVQSTWDESAPTPGSAVAEATMVVEVSTVDTQPGARSSQTPAEMLQASTWAILMPVPFSRHTSTTRRPLPRTMRKESSVGLPVPTNCVYR